MIVGISEAENKIIKSILEAYTDKYEFYFYGSRVKGNFTSLSDLDILIKSEQTIDAITLDKIKEYFDNSSLPFIVNFSVFNTIDVNFYNRIKKDLVPVF